MRATRSAKAQKYASFSFSSRRRHTRCGRDWRSDVCSSDLLAAPELKAVCAPPVRSAGDYLADSAAVTASGAGQHTAGRLCHPAGLLAGGARCAAATPAPPLVDIAARLALTRRRPATGRGQLNRSIELQLDTECYVPGTSSTSSMSEASYNIALPSNPLDELVLVPPRGATRCFRPA